MYGGYKKRGAVFRRGYLAEYELMKMLRSKGFYVVRIPVSGQRVPCDLLCSKRGIGKFAIEVKVTKGLVVYINKDRVRSLIEFANAFDLTPIVAIKWKKRFPNTWSFYEIKNENDNRFNINDQGIKIM